ncbi:hypothetical protein [Bailinhaonella thermotolerans]|uniref:hypothetical protein n=1 Tax=Bailinhaonella thermotolerans TaxID=1070861 RepID=UPI00192A3728|nr:hypothetical protein [Bailinhaonella thermotolerans]
MSTWNSLFDPSAPAEDPAPDTASPSWGDLFGADTPGTTTTGTATTGTGSTGAATTGAAGSSGDGTGPAGPSPSPARPAPAARPAAADGPPAPAAAAPAAPAASAPAAPAFPASFPVAGQTPGGPATPADSATEWKPLRPAGAAAATPAAPATGNGPTPPPAVPAATAQAPDRRADPATTGQPAGEATPDDRGTTPGGTTAGDPPGEGGASSLAVLLGHRDAELHRAEPDAGWAEVAKAARQGTWPDLKTLAGAEDTAQHDKHIAALAKTAPAGVPADRLYAHLSGWGPLWEHWRDPRVSAVYIDGRAVSVLRDGAVTPVPGFARGKDAAAVIGRLLGGGDPPPSGGGTRKIPGGELWRHGTTTVLEKTEPAAPAPADAGLEELVQAGVLSGGHAAHLARIVLSGGRVVVNGPHAHVLIQALAQFIPVGSRVYTGGVPTVPGRFCPGLPAGAVPARHVQHADYVVGTHLGKDAERVTALGQAGAIIGNPASALEAEAVVTLLGAGARMRAANVRIRG